VDKNKTIAGFSKLSKRKKIKWIVENFFKDPEHVMKEIISHWYKDEEKQQILDEISENTITNYSLPYGVAPNFLINGKAYALPLVTEESSVVAAACSAAKFWLDRGGFHCEVLGTTKLGHVHFFWPGSISELVAHEEGLVRRLLRATAPLCTRMEKRGGGIHKVSIRDMSMEMDNYYQLFVEFETCDSMGANFINTILEAMADELKRYFADQTQLLPEQQRPDVLMSILSNHTPDCLCRATVSCPVADLTACTGVAPEVFAERFTRAVRAAQVDTYRATTHNKGIYNGIDAVLMATANDFRAVEAAGHSHAARDGKYRSLSSCKIENGHFEFWLEVPLALGTVGGLTALHPMAKRSLELLGNPNARELMCIVAAAGLAQNFAAIRSLVTTGIQQGHMKMHLGNILNAVGANSGEKDQAAEHFAEHKVSYQDVKEFVETLRN